MNLKPKTFEIEMSLTFTVEVGQFAEEETIMERAKEYIRHHYFRRGGVRKTAKCVSTDFIILILRELKDEEK